MGQGGKRHGLGPLSHLTPCLFFLYLLLSFFLFLAVLGLELRAYTLSQSISPFFEGFFEIGSSELFAQAGFEPRSS
jgi:hypothetical protein